MTFDRLNTICTPFSPRNNGAGRGRPRSRVETFQETAAGLSAAKMSAEVERCFKCGTCTECDLCFLLCPDISLVKAGKKGYTVKMDYCKGCGICATSCPRNVIEIGASK